MQNGRDLSAASRHAAVKKAAIGGAFLMAMSAVGPGFLTQTATFTQAEGANFGFAILICILVDIIVQLNIWRVIVVAGKRAQMIANDVVPGLGYLLSALVALGGLFFNIGNVAGAGLGLNVLFGIPVAAGAIISAVIAIVILIVRNALKVVDWTVQALAVIAVLVLVYMLCVAKIPYATAAVHTVAPTKIDFYSILTIVGGTVGGYISFAGGHRLLEGGAKGQADLKYVNLGALTGIGLASVIRVMLFLVGLAVVVAGTTLDPTNPAASIFKTAAGAFGYKFFGLLLFAAGMSSIIGSTFTSTSFLDYAVSGRSVKYRDALTIGFIAFATVVFVFIGQPAKVLVVVGALNGFILPIALAILLVASGRQKIMGAAYRHPLWLAITGWIVVAFMAFASVKTVIGFFG